MNLILVLTSDYAVLLAEEFGRNPIVNDEAAFDIYPSSVPFSLRSSHLLIPTSVHPMPTPPRSLPDPQW
jgi:hypothetical protein